MRTCFNVVKNSNVKNYQNVKLEVWKTELSRADKLAETDELSGADKLPGTDELANTIYKENFSLKNE